MTTVSVLGLVGIHFHTVRQHHAGPTRGVSTPSAARPDIQVMSLQGDQVYCRGMSPKIASANAEALIPSPTPLCHSWCAQCYLDRVGC